MNLDGIGSQAGEHRRSGATDVQPLYARRLRSIRCMASTHLGAARSGHARAGFREAGYVCADLRHVRTSSASDEDGTRPHANWTKEAGYDAEGDGSPRDGRISVLPATRDGDMDIYSMNRRRRRDVEDSCRTCGAGRGGPFISVERRA
jgi:hypothetical protein